MRTTLSRSVAVVLCAGMFALHGDATVTLGEGSDGADAPARANARSVATVFGYVWNAQNEPIARAAVRLRNVATGRIEGHAVAADHGEFTFDNIEGGTYAIEYVDSQDRVIAVGHVFSVSPGETVATFIRVGSRASWFAGLLGSASSIAATAVSSAASIGVTALVPPARDVTPER